MNSRYTNRWQAQRGFTLVEMLVATVVVLVGLVAVAQLVPSSVLLNSNNRNDGTALVFAQREMEVLLEKSTGGLPYFNDPLGVTCPLSQTCYLGDPTQPDQIVGSPILVGASGQPLVDFSVAPVSGYSFTYIDPNDPFSAAYDVRWAVVTRGNGWGRRIIVGVFRRGMQTASLPVTLDSLRVRGQ
jgi:prepilin-type N-terminal cleavage/methylation domain-containing protein